MYDERTNLAQQVTENLRKFFGAKLLKTAIPRNIRLAEAPSYGKPVALYDPRSRGARVTGNWPRRSWLAITSIAPKPWSEKPPYKRSRDRRRKYVSGPMLDHPSSLRTISSGIAASRTRGRLVLLFSNSEALGRSMTAAVEVPKRRALGKGLESLLPGRSGFSSTPAPAAPPPAPDEGKPREIPVDQIERNPFQTRGSIDENALKELSASIAATGVVQPVLVRPLADNRFQLIAGERRWLASKLAGKTTVPAILRHVSDEQAMEMTIVENLQRTDLNPMEQARAYDRLGHQFKMTQEQMAQRTGKVEPPSPTSSGYFAFRSKCSKK